jgi:RNA polymerase sigma-70 factor (ECF subfamily)
MARFSEGDTAAFDVLYARHAPGLRAFFRRASGSPEQADDLLQVTFLHLVKARALYRPADGFTPWLYAIARNAARDHRSLRRNRFEHPTERHHLEAVPQEPPPEAPDAAMVQALRQALSELPESSREAVVLHQLHGLSFPEVARVVGSTTGAVKVRAFRGYERLRAAMARWKSERAL